MKKFTTFKKAYKVKSMESKHFAYVWHVDDVCGFSVPHIDGFSDLFTDCIDILNGLKLMRY